MSRWSTRCRRLSAAATRRRSALPPLSTEKSVLHTNLKKQNIKRYDAQTLMKQWEMRLKTKHHSNRNKWHCGYDYVLSQGRKSVRFGDFQFCEQAKSIIVVSIFCHHCNLRTVQMTSFRLWLSPIQRNKSRQSKPLRVQVMHSSVVAHQCFALKTLTWLGQIIKYSGTSLFFVPISLFVWCSFLLVTVGPFSDGLRRILCQVGLQQGPEGENSSLVDRLMLNDSRMWKGKHLLCLQFHQFGQDVEFIVKSQSVSYCVVVL